MKLSEIEEKFKKDEPFELDKNETKDIYSVLERHGISQETLVSTAMELYVPHPGIENREKAEKLFKRELKLALSDPNLCILIYAGLILEKQGNIGELPGISKENFKKDLTYLIADEVIGMSISNYIAGNKGTFEYIRYDKQKPGILSKLGPFMDDVIAGLIGGVSSNMYTRGSMNHE